jgi:SAM-dependent methyltransferase
VTIEYADGAESEVLSALRAARDVSAGSAELAGLVESWETAYHFSPARLGLLAPLRIRPGLRVVDLGCGSGVLTRALGEAGASVLGIEGTRDRAAAAQERCRDLADVRITANTITDGLAGAGPFDLALMCGVLEYSEQFAAGPERMLRSTVDTLSERGVLVVAIENQLGLKYLLGGAEDHRGTAWVGLADYPGAAPAPRTWSRQALRDLLASVGLTAQRWLMPYPDYKMPRLVLDESAFDQPAELVEKLVRDPLEGTFGGNDAASSGRILQRLAMDEGLGAQVAPSFLIVAARSDAALADAVEPGLAWLISGGRRPAWRRVRRLDHEHTLHTVHSGPGAPGSWLRQQHVAAEPLRPGRALDACLLDAMRTGDLAELRRLLSIWRQTCLAHARRADPAAPTHPYLPSRPDVDVLPADHLDIHPGNLIIGANGSVTRVDLEWLAGEGVDAELVMLRALLEFARDVTHGHAPHPWPGRTSAHGVLTELCALTGLADALTRRWPELVSAEAALQALVSGRTPDHLATEIDNDAHQSHGQPLWEVPGGLRTLRGDRAARSHEQELTEQLAEHRTHVSDLTDRLQATEHALAMAMAELDVKDDRMGRAFNELASAVQEAQSAWDSSASAEADRVAVEAEAARLRAEVAGTSARLSALEGSRLVRTARRSLWPAGRIVRGVRDLALARPGDEPDGVLRRLGPLAGLTGRYRKAAATTRADGLRFDVTVPTEPVAVGAGQVLELSGWVAHASIGVRSVAVRAGDKLVPASRGHHQPGVAAALRAGGVRAPDGSGVLARIPIAGTSAPGSLDLILVVTLADGSMLERPLPTVRLTHAVTEPVAARWPADGPKVAICLASYQPDIAFLTRQLDSLRAQKHANWICVISDDGSSNVAAIEALTEDDDRFVVVAHQENVGFYRNFERALSLAPPDADAIALCDQDDVWDADKLDTLLAALADPDVSLAYADMRLIDEHDEVLAPTFWRRRRNQWQDLDALLLLNTVTGAASLVRGSVVRDLVLPFPPGTPSAFHDQWVAATALAAGRLAFVDRPLHSYRQHGGAVTGRQDDRLDAGLPSGMAGWLGLALGRRVDDPELEAVAEYELRRVAQFATVLLMRNWHRLGAVRDRLAELTRVERDLRPLAKRTRTSREETAGAERRLLAAALRWNSLKSKRLRVPNRL